MVCLFGRLSTKPARRVGERPSNFGFDQQGHYALVNTLAECLYHDISREIFDGSEPALRAVIANGQIKFLARYTLRGACYYEPLGRFPRMSIKDARECARELYNRYDDNRVPDEEYGAIPF